MAAYRPWLVENGQWVQIDNPLPWPLNGETAEIKEALTRSGYRATLDYGGLGLLGDARWAPCALVVWSAYWSEPNPPYPYVCQVALDLEWEVVYCAGFVDVLEVYRRFAPLMQPRPRPVISIGTEECIYAINRARIAYAEYHGEQVCLRFGDGVEPLFLHGHAANLFMQQSEERA